MRRAASAIRGPYTVANIASSRSAGAEMEIAAKARAEVEATPAGVVSLSERRASRGRSRL